MNNNTHTYLNLYKSLMKYFNEYHHQNNKKLIEWTISVSSFESINNELKEVFHQLEESIKYSFSFNKDKLEVSNENSFQELSTRADYFNLDICELTELLYKSYEGNIESVYPDIDAGSANVNNIIKNVVKQNLDVINEDDNDKTFLQYTFKENGISSNTVELEKSIQKVLKYNNEEIRNQIVNLAINNVEINPETMLEQLIEDIKLNVNHKTFEERMQLKK